MSQNDTIPVRAEAIRTSDIAFWTETDEEVYFELSAGKSSIELPATVNSIIIDEKSKGTDYGEIWTSNIRLSIGADDVETSTLIMGMLDEKYIVVVTLADGTKKVFGRPRRPVRFHISAKNQYNNTITVTGETYTTGKYMADGGLGDFNEDYNIDFKI